MCLAPFKARIGQNGPKLFFCKAISNEGVMPMFERGPKKGPENYGKPLAVEHHWKQLVVHAFLD